MTRHISRIIRIFGAMLLAILPALIFSGSRSAGKERQRSISEYALKNAAGKDLGLTFQDKYELYLDTPLPGATGRIRLNPGNMFAVQGNEIFLLQKRNDNWYLRASFDNDREVLDIQDGAIEYQILVLDRAGLKVIDFLSFDEPRVTGDYPVDNRNLAHEGHFIERFGSYAYVVDGSIGGFKVIDFKIPGELRLVAEFSSHSGVPSDIRIRNRTVFLLAPGELMGIRIGEFLDPRPELVRTYKTTGAASSMAINNSYAFIADGSRLTVVGIDPDAGNFLRDEADYVTLFRIGHVVLRDARIYLLGTGGALEVLDIPGFDRN